VQTKWRCFFCLALEEEEEKKKEKNRETGDLGRRGNFRWCRYRYRSHALTLVPGSVSGPSVNAASERTRARANLLRSQTVSYEARTKKAQTRRTIRRTLLKCFHDNNGDDGDCF
jgi:hypothetical protein